MSRLEIEPVPFHSPKWTLPAELLEPVKTHAILAFYKTMGRSTAKLELSQDSVAHLNRALPIKLKCIWQNKPNSNSLEYEDVLYFDLQPHPIACTPGSIVMEWKQTLFEIWMLSDDWLMWYNMSLNNLFMSVTLTSRSVRGWGYGDGTA